jgi:hypothetical protein
MGFLLSNLDREKKIRERQNTLKGARQAKEGTRTMHKMQHDAKISLMPSVQGEPSAPLSTCRQSGMTASGKFRATF